MELRRLWLAAVVACVPQTKRLVLRDDMMKPGVVAGPTVAASRTTREGPGSDAFSAIDPVGGAGAAGSPKAVPAVAKKPAAPAVRAPSATTPSDQRYVLRLVEHGRTWEVELPEQTGGYEVRIPIGPVVEAPTLADEELMGRDPKTAGPPKSYLSAMAKIAEMYASHRYELALIEAVDLGQQYPKEARIEAMKGSLYQRIGKLELARESWKKALDLDPSDVSVAEALRGLKGE